MRERVAPPYFLGYPNDRIVESVMFAAVCCPKELSEPRYLLRIDLPFMQDDNAKYGLILLADKERQKLLTRMRPYELAQLSLHRRALHDKGMILVLDWRLDSYVREDCLPDLGLKTGILYRRTTTPSVDERIRMAGFSQKASFDLEFNAHGKHVLGIDVYGQDYDLGDDIETLLLDLSRNLDPVLTH